MKRRRPPRESVVQFHTTVARVAPTAITAEVVADAEYAASRERERAEYGGTPSPPALTGELGNPRAITDGTAADAVPIALEYELGGRVYVRRPPDARTWRRIP